MAAMDPFQPYIMIYDIQWPLWPGGAAVFLSLHLMCNVLRFLSFTMMQWWYFPVNKELASNSAVIVTAVFALVRHYFALGIGNSRSNCVPGSLDLQHCMSPDATALADNSWQMHHVCST